MKRSSPANDAKKFLSQNFLTHDGVRRRLLNACHLQDDEEVVEIGPGQGSLTFEIANQVQHVTALEKDKALAKTLALAIKNKRLDPRCSIYCGDFLKCDLPSLTGEKPVKIIGNIPYHISTPIIEKLIAHRHHISQAFLTVQLEFAQRCAAQPNNKNYGAFTCFLQYHADVKILFKIHPQAFRPVPKVVSCLMQIDFLDKPRVSVSDEKRLFTLIKTAFSQRRKTIVNALQSTIDKDMLLAALKKNNINKKSRAENLTLTDFACLAAFKIKP